MTDRISLDNITVVLNKPRYPENIGAAARAMCNMGIHRLVVVNPENHDIDRIKKMATHVAAGIVDKMVCQDSLKTALSDFNYIIGSTARKGRRRLSEDSPARVAESLITISQNNRVAILFGPEDRGLTNDDIKYCQALVTIPTDEFSSLNLAQAVMVMCYEIYLAGREEPPVFEPKLASRRELEEMYDHLKDVLVRISFINQDNPDYWMNNLRRFFDRLKPRAKEVSIIRGVCRQIDWYGGKKYQDGVKDGAGKTKC